MTNQDIDRLIERNRRSLRLASFGVSMASGLLGLGLLLLACFSSLAELAGFFFIGGVLAILICLGVTFDEVRTWRAHQRKEALAIWRALGHNHAFGLRLPESTQLLGGSVRQVYELDPAGKLFPLRQAIRLLDTHRRQQMRLQLVENRLGELRSLQEKLSSKMAQLQELGEDYPAGARNLQQINADLEALRLVHGQIRGSCARLEAITIAVQKAAQSRQLRRELETLSARLPQNAEAVEPAFEAESLEEIERQIGREIETYLQLERETEEHLR